MNLAWWLRPLMWLRGGSASTLGRARSSSANNRHPWWDTSDDETLLWQEHEHIERSHRMQQLEQGLSKLRATPSGPRFTG